MAAPPRSGCHRRQPGQQGQPQQQDNPDGRVHQIQQPEGIGIRPHRFQRPAYGREAGGCATDKHDRDGQQSDEQAGTGIRVGELLQLQVGDLVLRERAGWITIREGKHGGYRQIPLTKEVRQALTDYLTIHPINNEDHEQYQDERTLLWWGKHGPLTHRSSVLRILRKYTIRAELKPIGPHVLRHTFATQYLQANPDDLRGLAALMGHSDLNTVMVYTEPTLQGLTGRMERMRHLRVD